jgi:hypothetical protein
MSRLIDLECPNCGGRLEAERGSDRAAWPHCGTELLIQQRAHAVTRDEGPLACPRCRRADQVQNVYAIYSGGLSTVDYAAWIPPPPRSSLPAILAPMKAVSQTQLSARLAPTPYPVKGVPGCLKWSVVLCWVIAGVPLLLGGLGSEMAAGLVFWLGLAIVLTIVAFVIRSNQQGKVPEWERLAGVWSKLGYCSRCDGVFLPGVTWLVPADSLNSFLRAGDRVFLEMQRPEGGSRLDTFQASLAEAMYGRLGELSPALAEYVQTLQRNHRLTSEELAYAAASLKNEPAVQRIWQNYTQLLEAT